MAEWSARLFVLNLNDLVSGRSWIILVLSKRIITRMISGYCKKCNEKEKNRSVVKAPRRIFAESLQKMLKPSTLISQRESVSVEDANVHLKTAAP